MQRTEEYLNLYHRVQSEKSTPWKILKDKHLGFFNNSNYKLTKEKMKNGGGNYTFKEI